MFSNSRYVRSLASVLFNKLSYNRFDRVKTFNTLKKQGYTGDIYIVIGTDDKELDKYFKKFKDRVLVFNKDDYDWVDLGDNIIDDKVKKFLILAAYRHVKFDFRSIAEFYVQVDEKIKKLMEDSALVIIDYNKAIERGWIELNDSLLDLIEKEDDEEN